MLEMDFFYLFWDRRYLFIIIIIFYFFPLIPAVNAPAWIRAWIHVPEGQLEYESKLRLKRERPIGSKDVPPRKRRTQMSIGTTEVVHEICLKRGRPIGSKVVPPRKWRTQMSIRTPEEVHD